MHFIIPSLITKLHIVSFDIPFPADYGGVMDVFYKLRALHERGIEIYLHCFEYGHRTPQELLTRYCREVHYYPRRTGWKGLHFSLPYIVSSRKNPELLRNLIHTDAPVLFEGLHTTYYMSHPALKKRLLILRSHNIESEYYRALASIPAPWYKRMYYLIEAGRLKLYEKKLKGMQVVWPISQHDQTLWKTLHPGQNTSLVPAFHPFQYQEALSEQGTYCLYHGNLSVSDNAESALFLAREVFNNLPFRLIIAGRKPTKKLLDLASDRIQIIADPTDEKLEELIRNAHIHVLPAFQFSGSKLKILHALYHGRFVMSNDVKLKHEYGSSLILAQEVHEWKSQIEQFMKKPFDQEQALKRQQILKSTDPVSNVMEALQSLNPM